MQTNREDCGQRYREVIIPEPKSKIWAEEVSQAFRAYLTTLADAKRRLIDNVRNSGFEHVASVTTDVSAAAGETEDGEPDDGQE